MAPIYDSGSSLGYDKTIALMKDRDEIVCKPFKNHHDEQIKLVSSFDWIDFSALSDIRKIIKDVLGDKQFADYIGERRKGVICDLAEQRVLNLKEYDSSHKKQIDLMKYEVKDNIAAKYNK